MNICFLMYPWEKIEVDTDSTIRLIHESAMRGFNVAVVGPGNLSIRDTVVYGYCSVIQKGKKKVPTNVKTFYKEAKFQKKMLPLKGFDVIFMRDNPPIDVNMLNVLDSIKGEVFMINGVDGLRKANSKIYTATLDKEHDIIPSTYLSKNIEYLKRIIKESKHDKMILKPLDGYGGSGVIILETKASSNVNSLLEFYVNKEKENNYVIVQEYVEGADKGDVRILMLNGKPIGAMRRVPAADDHRSNVHAGGRVVKHTLTAQEKLLCNIVGPKLVADGLFFAGLDVIGGKLLEVNVCSPGGITRINKLNRKKLEKEVIDFVERTVTYRNAEIEERILLRKAIDDAASSINL